MISHFLHSRPTIALAVVAFGFLIATSANAQNKQYTENKPDQALKSEARVDPSTLGMSLEIPFGGAPGRAGNSVAAVMKYSSKQWRVKYAGGFQGNILFHVWTLPRFSENAVAGWTSSLDAPWIEYTGRNQKYDENGSPLSDNPEVENYSACYIPRIHLHLPDGSSHELRQSDTQQCLDITDPPPTFSGNFYSTDGSRMRFDATAGVLYIPDGGRYWFGAEQTVLRYNNEQKIGRWATQYHDRNGNAHVYNFTNVTDTVGRVYANLLAEDNPTSGDQVYSVPGVGGQNLSYTLRWRNLADVLSAGGLSYTSNQKCVGPNVYQTVSPYLFTSGSQTHVCADTNLFNPVVLAEVELPNGQKYQFKYNVFGEMDKIIYPTGGYERFRYDAIPTLAYPSPPYDQANRGVVERWVSPSGTGSEESTHHWTYSAGTSPRKTTITAPDGSSTELYLHGSSSVTSYGFETPTAGMSYDERTYNATGQMLRRSLTEWSTQTPPGSSQPRNPHVTKTIKLILDTGGNALAATSTMQYDADLNVTATSHHDFASVAAATAQTGPISDIPDGALVRIEETTFLVNDTTISSTTRQAYRDRNLVALPTSSRVKKPDGTVGTIVAQTEIKYDEAAYPLLTYGAVTGWTDPATTIRGMATTNRSWLNPGGTWLETHTQYDQCGSPRKNWDARGYLSEMEYSSAYQYAYPTRTISADPDGAGSGSALITTSTYDFSSGVPTAATDANSQPTTFEYALTDTLGNSNQLQRLTKVIRPDGGWTAYGYSYTPGNLFKLTKSALDASRNAEATEHFDGLGRPWRKQQSEGATSIYTDLRYDPMGRSWKTSNPYRTGTPLWTTTIYDALGRVLTVTTPDNATVTTSYSGNTVTVTDQAQKQRKSVTDALGRLKNVFEDPTPNGLNYETSYHYDVLDNLTAVNQGSQQRFFMYDSLKRLIRARNPEQDNHPSLTLSDPQTGNNQWSWGYQYDENGNLTQKTDARGIIITYEYDGLNRDKTINYSSTTISPDITRHYDGATKGKGRLWESYAGGTETAGTTVEHVKIYSYDELGRPKDQRQRFKTNNVWSAEYKVERSYNLAGGVISQTYPSERTVSYGYDPAGRTQSFTGSLGDGSTRTYATAITYSPFGGMTKEQFGTTQTLYHNLAYNVRGQMYYIGVGALNDGWSGDYGKLIYYFGEHKYFGESGTDNNGNISLIDNHLPNGPLIHDHFKYDSINRLTEIFEEDTSPRFKQKYNDYDRYGNRTINADASWGGVNEQQFTVDPANNRLGVPGGQSGTMTYDAAGNLTTDTYSGSAVTRAYDADNRMTSETQNGGVSAGAYTYNADGQRVRRKVDGVETWQVYGMEGELLAEYAAGTAPTSPQKEYGYRNGELLVTAEAAAPNAGPENVIWTSAVGVSVSGNNLTKTGSVGWNAGAVSTQSIASGDGYVEFTANSNSANTMCGLSNGNTNQSFEEIDFALYPWIDGNLYVFENGTSRGSVGAYTAGDLFRVAVEGGVVKYRKNGALLYTSTVTPTYPLLVDTTLHPSGSQITTAIISSGSSGGQQNVSWGSAVGVATSGNNLTKTGADGWNAGAVSTQSIPSGDGYVEFTANSNSANTMCGLSNGNTNQSYEEIDFALYPWIDGNLYVFENGTSRGSVGAYNAGDLFRVAVEGGVVKYRKNGALLYTSAVAPTYPLLVDTTLFPTGSQITTAIISSGGSGGQQNAGWTSAVGVSTSGNSLTKTSVDGWNAGAVSTQTISAGDGYVEVTASETTTSRMIGLGNGDTSQSYTDIEYAFKLGGGGILDIWEAGNVIGYFGAYATGDVLRVGVEGGVVKYRKNGTLLYTSTVAPTYPLLVDTSLYSNGSTLTNVVISSGSGSSASSANIKWLVSDHLGTPRIIIDQTGTLANVKRHDYLPFGEELLAGTGGRTLAQGYSGDNVRQKFTSKERDNETGLDYFLARYYSSTQGRFTSPDEFKGGPDELYVLGTGNETKQALPYSEITNPQSINKYQYTYNNPLRFIDPDGHRVRLTNQSAADRKKMAGRLLFNLKKSERKYFEIRLNDKTGQYTLETRGDVDRALSKNHTKAFEYLVQTVRAEGTVRAAISETYTLKNGVTESSRPGATIPAKDSASGEIEVYVSRQSVSAMGQPATVEGTKTEFLPAPASIVAGHEVLGHGRLQLMGQDSEQGAIDVENELRRGRGLEERKYDRRP